MHFGTFPSPTGPPSQLQEMVANFGIEVIDIQPGQTLE